MRTTNRPTALYHFTCAHAHAVLGKRCTLKPHRHPFLGRSLLWLTDMDTPEVMALGLTSEFSTCDRTAFRYRIEQPSLAVSWVAYKAAHVLPREAVETLESLSRPEHWWVSDAPLRAHPTRMDGAR